MSLGNSDLEKTHKKSAETGAHQIKCVCTSSGYWSLGQSKTPHFAWNEKKKKAEQIL